MTSSSKGSSTVPTYRHHLAGPIRSLTARAKVLRVALMQRAISAREFDRHLRDSRTARKRDASRSQQLFGKGATAEIIAYLDLPDYAIVGLEAHGVLYAVWMARAAMESDARDRGSLLRHIFSCPKRLDWCRTEGARICMEFSRKADEERTRAFHERQARTSDRSWRKDPVTEFQIWQMNVISARLGVPIPGGLKNGTAHDWIAIHKANPDYWAIPAKLPDWEL